jgi:hypothetical protein
MIQRFRLILMICLGCFLINACKTSGHSEKFYAKQEKNKSNMEQKEYDNKVKSHNDIQSDNTKKMIKQTEKEAKKRNKSKKPKLKKC